MDIQAIYQPRLDLGLVDVPDDTEGSDSWFTPAWIIELVRDVLGGIDLDPASCEIAQGVVKAKRYYTRADDGLSRPWIADRLFANPPYSRPQPWAEKLIAEWSAGNVKAAIFLTSNATDSRWGQLLLRHCQAICFPANRLRHWNPLKSNDAPSDGSLLTYFGPEPDRFRERFAPYGWTWADARTNGGRP